MMWKEEYKSRFKPSGRIGRKDFLKNSIFNLLSYFLLFYMLLTLMPVFTQTDNVFIKVSFLFGLFYAFILVYVWFCLLAKRMHDIGFRLWWLWLAMIVIQVICGQVFPPVKSVYVAQGIDLFLLLLLFFKKGQKQANKFGNTVE